jgi:hypothetical protein
LGESKAQERTMLLEDRNALAAVPLRPRRGCPAVASASALRSAFLPNREPI